MPRFWMVDDGEGYEWRLRCGRGEVLNCSDPSLDRARETSRNVRGMGWEQALQVWSAPGRVHPGPLSPSELLPRSERALKPRG